MASHDFRVLDDRIIDHDVCLALADLGIYHHNSVRPALRELIGALDIAGRCSGPYTLPGDPEFHEDPEQLIFYLEHTRESVTAALQAEQCGFREHRGWIHSRKLGYTALKDCETISKGSTSCDEDFKSAQREVITDSARGREVNIGSVLLCGEAAEDERMIALLRQVLSEQFMNGDTVDLRLVQKFSSNPAFAVSRAAAWDELPTIEYQRSGYEDAPAQEL